MKKQLILFDFDDTIVKSSDNSSVIREVLDDLMRYIRYPSNDVFILTARYRRVPVVKFFKNIGIENIEVVAVGELNPLAKSSFVMNKLSQKEYEAVRIYEDKEDNISAVAQVVKSLGVDFSYMLVQERSADSPIRKFIEYTLDEEEQDMSKSPGAGIVVVRKFDTKWKVLGLVVNGEYDLPKGKMEKGEKPLEAAIRETAEESSISQLDFKWGKQNIQIQHLTFYIAATQQDAAVQLNPESGIYEHEDAVWVSFKKIKSNIYPFLVPVVEWAESIIIK